MRLAAAALLGSLLGVAPVLAQPSGSHVLVVPFENTARDPRAHWLAEASAVLVADALNARGLNAITRGERLRAFEQLHLPASASLSRATIIKVGQLLGASEVIIGSFTVTGTELTVSAHTVRIDVGRLDPDVVERAPLPELFGLFDRVAARLARTSASPAPRDPLPPLDAFEHYIKGLVAESPATQAEFLETALKQFPKYDRAHLALWEVRTEQGDHEAALAEARAVAGGSRFERRGRFLAALSLLELRRHDEAFDLFQALAESPSGDPASGAALFNNLGVIQLRRGGTPQTGLPTYYLTKAADGDPGDADILFNLGYAYAIDRNNEAAIYWLREALRRDPADADAHLVLSAALQASGSTVEAARERDLARQLSSDPADIERQGGGDKAHVPKGLERVRTQLEGARSLTPEQAIVDTAQREQRDLAAFHLERGRRLYEREEDREAMAELRRAVFLSPYESQAHLLIGRIHLRAGRPQEAVDALKIAIWAADSEAARIALAEAYLKQGNTSAARAQLERALAINPTSPEAKRLLAAIGGLAP